MTLDLPAQLPDYLTLGGDEDGGVSLDCRHPAHGGDAETIIYLGWSVPRGVAKAEDLNDFVRCFYEHANMHTKQDAKDQREWRNRFATRFYAASHRCQPKGEGTWYLAPLNRQGAPVIADELTWTGDIEDLFANRVPAHEAPEIKDGVQYAILP